MVRVNGKLVGAGVAVAIAAGIGYALLSGEDEEAPFETVLRDGALSVRDYPALLVAETMAEGTREKALSRGFLTLADYIFGKARGGARLPMTAPVLADGADDGRGWRTRFILPECCTLDTLPVPADADVALHRLHARRVAALRFAGDADDAALDAQERRLREWMRLRDFGAAGPVEYAFYNSPFVPGPLRRNEIFIPLAA